MTSPVPTADDNFPGEWLDVAEGICERYYSEFPDHGQRYGERGRAYCAHDNAYLVAWLVMALDRIPDAFTRNTAWLRGVLQARNFPTEAFERNLELVGEAVTQLRPDDAHRIATLVADARRS